MLRNPNKTTYRAKKPWAGLIIPGPRRYSMYVCSATHWCHDLLAMINWVMSFTQKIYFAGELHHRLVKALSYLMYSCADGFLPWLVVINSYKERGEEQRHSSKFIILCFNISKGIREINLKKANMAVMGLCTIAISQYKRVWREIFLCDAF